MERKNRNGHLSLDHASGGFDVIFFFCGSFVAVVGGNGVVVVDYDVVVGGGGGDGGGGSGVCVCVCVYVCVCVCV